jgi:hypothetical protein
MAMTARRSFDHSMGKYQQLFVNKSVAIITAWRGVLKDANGQPYPEVERRHRNEVANESLAVNIRQRGLSHYPVVGAGQEEEGDQVVVCKEMSFIVEPVGTMNEQNFIGHIQQLLFNPTGEAGHGPFPHTQWGATVKLPSDPMAFTLSSGGSVASDPADYTVVDDIGDSARPRQPADRFYTQMKYGPRAALAMMDQYDQAGDVGNIVGLPGQRFHIADVP